MSRHIGFSEFSSVLFILCFSRLDSGIFDWCLSKYSWFFSASLFDRFLEELEDVTVCMSWKQIAGCSRNLEMFRVWGVWRSPRWLVGGLHGWEENGWPWDPSLTGAVLHDFTIGLLLVFDNLYFEENTFLYTLCICILCRTKANNWGYSNDITGWIFKGWNWSFWTTVGALKAPEWVQMTHDDAFYPCEMFWGHLELLRA